MKNEFELQQWSSPSPLSCTVNGEEIQLNVPESKRLLAILREDLELSGTKISCEIGRCGACMVMVDGKAFNACLTMAYQCNGKAITTIEGIADREGLHPVQQAFLDEGGYQCGYCTPGMIVSVTAMLLEQPNPTLEEVEEALSGNLCRCTGYGGIIRAVHRVIEQGRDHP